MKVISNEQTLRNESLILLLYEVESIINQRPLRKVSDDPNDWEAHTANYLLLLQASPMCNQVCLTNTICMLNIDSTSYNIWQMCVGNDG